MRRLAGLTALAAVGLCGVARADTTVIGSLNLPAGGAQQALAPNQIGFQVANGDTNYVATSPVTGIITSWSFRQTIMAPGDSLTLRMLDDSSATTVRALATSDPQLTTAAGDVVRGPFPASIAIQAGERIGVQSTSGNVPVTSGIAGADEAFVTTPSLADGSTSTFDNGNGGIPNQTQLLIQATVDFVPSTSNPPPPNSTPSTPPPSTPPPISPDQVLAALPPPVEGRNVDIATVSGSVLVKLPGAGSFAPLAVTGAQLPVNAEVDVTGGRVRLVAADAPLGPTTKTSDFYGGTFKVTQPASGKGRVDLKLTGPLATCAKFTSRSARAAASKSKAKAKPKTRFVWGDGHGTFRTVGQSGSAAVRGTKWEVIDRCDGSTQVVVARGIVAVADNVKHKTSSSRPGTAI